MAQHIYMKYDQFCELDNALWDILEMHDPVPYTVKTGALAMTYYHFKDGSSLGFDDNPHSRRIMIFPSQNSNLVCGEGNFTILYMLPQ